MNEPLTRQQLLEVIERMTIAAGPPSAEMLRDHFGLQLLQSTGAWRSLVRDGIIQYDDQQRVVIVK